MIRLRFPFRFPFRFRLLPDTIAARTIAVLLVGLTVSHVVSMGAYRTDLLHQLGMSTERQLAERLVAVRAAMAEAPLPERERTAHLLSSPSLDIHWSPASLITDRPAAEDAHLALLRAGLVERAPALREVPLRLAHADEGFAPAAPERSSHVLLAAMALPDGSWVNIRITTVFSSVPFAGSHDLLLSTGLMAIAIVGLSVVLIRASTAPLRAMARAADRLGVDVTAAPLPEDGPREIRQAARAFNEMQQRIRRLIADRTQVLAALSHDLRTPITVMRLRAEFMEDEEQRAKMLTDLDEMEAMVGSTLAFLRDGTDREQTEVVDLAAMLETICNTMSDAGRAIAFNGLAHAPLRCRPSALKRAFTNLIDNAVKYGAVKQGGQAWVTLAAFDGNLRVDIVDTGPGIPEAELDKVFNPFYRIEGSRSRETGGFGLGLTIARTTVRAHGGELELANRPEGGLRATVLLPWVPAS